MVLNLISDVDFDFWHLIRSLIWTLYYEIFDQLVLHLQGEGPIHLIGSHCIDFYDNMAGEADSEGEDEEMEVRFSFLHCFSVG